MPRKRLSQDEIEAFREALCNVATRRFAERGYAGVTLRGLASELGCSPTTPYRYFRDKRDIFAAVQARAFARLADASEAAAESCADPIERLRTVGTAYLEFALREPQAYHIVFELAQPDPSDHPELAKQRQRAWQVLHGTVDAALCAGRLRGELETLSHICWAGLHGLATLHLAGQLRTLSLAELVEPMMETLLHGASSEPRAEGEAP